MQSLKNIVQKYQKFLLTILVVVATGLPICLAASGYFVEESFSPKNGQVNGENFGRTASCLDSDRTLVSAPDRHNDQRGAVDMISLTSGTVEFSLNGQNAGDRFGSSITVLPDVNGDNQKDFAVGAPGANSGKGKVYIISGVDGSILHQLVAFTSDSQGARFGSKIANLGQIGANKYIAISAPQYAPSPAYTPGAPVNPNTPSGLIEIHNVTGASPSGSPSSSPSASPSYYINNSMNGYFDDFATSLAEFGDNNGNGRREFAIGAPSAFNYSTNPFTETGGIYIYEYDPNTYGMVYLKYFNGNDSDFPVGQIVENIGDINGDGTEDLFVGTPNTDDANSSGKFIVYSGVNLFLTPSPSPSYSPSYSPSPSVSPSGSPSYSPSSTPSPSASATPYALCEIRKEKGNNDLGGGFASRAIGVGDLDKDGRNDFAMAHLGANQGAGQVRLYSYNGTNCVLLDSFSLPGATSSTRFGKSLEYGTCKASANNVPNLLVGSNGSQTGALHIFRNDSDILQLPTSSDYYFRLGRNGTVDIRNAYDKEPMSQCSLTVYARLTVGNKKLPLETIDISTADSIIMSHKIPNMPWVLKIDGEHPVIHMATETTCQGGLKHRSNVFARKMNCGVGEEGVKPSRWINLLKNSFIQDATIQKKVKRQKRRIKRRQRKVLRQFRRGH